MSEFIQQFGRVIFNGFYFITNSESKVSQKMTVKEHFVYTDSEGTLYHFVVEGSGFADASRVPAEVRRDMNC